MYYAKVLVILVVSLCVTAYPSGAPQGACDSLTPVHETHKAQRAPKPFTITTDKESLTQASGQTIKVTIAGKDATKDFKGFIIVARKPGTTTNIGTFKVIKDAKLLTCKTASDAATHSDANPKKKVVLEWVPPKNYKDKVTFTGTIVQDFKKYWTGVKSKTVTIQ